MTQEKIIESLLKALNQGTGNLDDLANLLKRVQGDIDDAKKEQEAEMKKAELARGQKVAELATRLLNKEMTETDMAFILSEYFGAPFSEKDIKELNNNISSLHQLYADIDKIAKSICDKPEKKSAAKSPDDIIHKFLKDFGLD